MEFAETSTEQYVLMECKHHLDSLRLSEADVALEKNTSCR